MGEKQTTRVNITMSTELVEFYQKQADEMGVSRASAMVFALQTYKDQKQALEISEIKNLLKSVYSDE